MRCVLWALFFFAILPLSIQADTNESEEAHRQALRARIHPSSLRDHLLFSSLYPQSIEGKSALQQAWKILAGHTSENPPPLPPDFGLTAAALVKLIQPGIINQGSTPELPQETIALIDAIGASLPHRKLKGHTAKTLQEIEQLSPQEIDLGRALILLDTPNPGNLTSVEAALDVLALELLAHIGKDADDETKISALTHLLFHDLKIRFPPQSETSEKAQQFSDLSSVLFSRRGVCLGASVLYLTLAQRIGLPLSIYTPPGHIFVAHKGLTRLHVIETTARGIDIPIDHYLGLSLKSLPERNMKEVVGMVIFNRTSVYLKDKKWDEALKAYQKALSFESGDELQQMISLCELLNGNEKTSKKMAQEALSHLPDYRLEPDLLIVDLAQGTLSKKAAETIIEFSEAEGEQLLKAIDSLQKLNAEETNSFVVPFHLAHAWLSYGKPKEALPLLERLCKREDALCSIHALLAYLYLERMNITGAWNEATLAVKKAQQHNCLPRSLYHLVIELQQESPHCTDISDMLVSQVPDKSHG
jgi:tetratricopeptide (TPR) repeat protein